MNLLDRPGRGHPFVNSDMPEVGARRYWYIDASQFDSELRWALSKWIKEAEHKDAYSTEQAAKNGLARFKAWLAAQGQGDA